MSSALRACSAEREADECSSWRIHQLNLRRRRTVVVASSEWWIQIFPIKFALSHSLFSSTPIRVQLANRRQLIIQWREEANPYMHNPLLLILNGTEFHTRTFRAQPASRTIYASPLTTNQPIKFQYSASQCAANDKRRRSHSERFCIILMPSHTCMPFMKSANRNALTH